MKNPPNYFLFWLQKNKKNQKETSDGVVNGFFVILFLMKNKKQQQQQQKQKTKGERDGRWLRRLPLGWASHARLIAAIAPLFRFVIVHVITKKKIKK